MNEWRIKQNQDPERDMTDIEIILYLIEHVLPDDTGQLDEIDTRVCAYVGWKQVLLAQEVLGWEHPSIGNSARLGKIPELYTRSRDALKSIRVDGWFYDISSDKDGVDCYADRGGANLFEALEFKTEELAELWVIINTIEWSRDND